MLSSIKIDPNTFVSPQGIARFCGQNNALFVYQEEAIGRGEKRIINNLIVYINDRYVHYSRDELIIKSANVCFQLCSKLNFIKVILE